MTLRSILVASLVAAGVLAPTTATPSAAPAGADLATYIVVYKHAPRVDLAAADGIAVRHRYSSALHGFAAEMSHDTARRLAADPAVAHVEPDGPLTLTATQSPVPNWGLDRIDQAALPLSNSYTWINDAAAVRIYVVDTGIQLGHPEFAVNRASWGTNTSGDGINTDCNGHGTHLAGIAGGRSVGVAKNARLVAVKVFGCGPGGGTVAGAIAGIDWVKLNHIKPAVAVFGAAAGISPALDTAVNDAITAGVLFTLPAGNANTSACNYSPSRVIAGFTVGATRSNDQRATWSNYGTCLDAFAPGESIYSAWISPGTNIVSGTSQSTAFAAGVAAQYLAIDPTATPATVTSALIAASTLNVVPNPGTGSPNRLLRTIW